MLESVVAHITKAGYDLIKSVLSGEESQLKITGVAFNGATSFQSLAPYEPSVFDTSLPSEVFRVTDENLIRVIKDPEDGEIVVQVKVNRDIAGGNFYLNGVGVIANDSVLFATNSLAITKVEDGSELIFNIKILFLPDQIASEIINKPPTPENQPVFYTVTPFEDIRSGVIIPAGTEGIVYDFTLPKQSIYAYLTIEVSSATDMLIDYIAVGTESVNYNQIVLARNIRLSTSDYPRLDIKIPIPFKELVVAVKKQTSDVIYSLQLQGVRLA